MGLTQSSQSSQSSTTSSLLDREIETKKFLKLQDSFKSICEGPLLNPQDMFSSLIKYNLEQCHQGNEEKFLPLLTLRSIQLNGMVDICRAHMSQSYFILFLGHLYENGLGDLPKSLAKAHKYYKLAKTLNNPHAKTMLKYLSKDNPELSSLKEDIVIATLLKDYSIHMFNQGSLSFLESSCLNGYNESGLLLADIHISSDTKTSILKQKYDDLTKKTYIERFIIISEYCAARGSTEHMVKLSNLYKTPVFDEDYHNKSLKWKELSINTTIREDEESSDVKK